MVDILTRCDTTAPEHFARLGSHVAILSLATERTYESRAHIGPLSALSGYRARPAGEYVGTVELSPPDDVPWPSEMKGPGSV